MILNHPIKIEWRIGCFSFLLLMYFLFYSNYALAQSAIDCDRTLTGVFCRERPRAPTVQDGLNSLSNVFRQLRQDSEREEQRGLENSRIAEEQLREERRLRLQNRS